MGFKDSTPFTKRVQESRRILEAYPDMIPVICEKGRGDMDIHGTEKKKYLVPNTMTVGQFMFVLRKRIQLSPEKAMFLFFTNGLMATTSTLIATAYEHHGDPDGFLYMTYTSESCFGFVRIIQ
jgi:GABA(A) receptor-associated protein